MENIKLIHGNTADEIWMQVAADIEKDELLDYDAMLQQPGLPQVLLNIEIDPGGGFEGGYELTRFTAPIKVENDFRFALHHETFLDKAGKFLGLEDKVIGYAEFDKEFIIKTNDVEKVKAMFSDVGVRSFFQLLKDFSLHIKHEDTGAILELELDRALTDISELRPTYDAFSKLIITNTNAQLV